MNDPMRIWIFNQFAVPPSEAGGTRHHDLARALNKLGHDVTIVAANFNHYKRQNIVKAEGIKTHDGVPYLWIEGDAYAQGAMGRLKAMLGYAFRCYKHFKSQTTLEKPDVILASSPTLFGTYAAYKIARYLHVPFVMEVRDVWPDTLVALGRVPKWHPIVILMKHLEKTLYRRAIAVISLLPGAVDYIATTCRNPKKVFWIPNGIDVRRIPKPTSHKNGVFTVIYAGSHGIANGLESIVDSAKVLQDNDVAVQFRFIGDGPCKPALEKQATDYGLTNIRFEPAVSKDDIYTKLSEADAFVVNLKKSPLYKHGISLNKLYDYMGLAKPVVIGIDAANNPIAESGGGISVAPDDPEAMAAAITSLANMNAQDRAAMGQKAYKHVRETYAFDILGVKLEQILAAASKTAKK